MSQPLRIGTRGSPLALAQAHMVAAALRTSAGVETEIVPITTTGDLIQDRALADGRTDLSVHSMKDVETLRPDSLLIAAMLERADTRDRLIGADSLAALPEGARVGTASPRRTAQLLARRPDLRCAIIRGNVQTRLAKIAAGDYDATLLAAAGLDRLGLALGAPHDLLPAPAQGAIGVETLADRSDLAALLSAIDHRPTHEAVSAERAFLAALGGDCHSAVAALATGGVVNAEILSADGSEIRSGEGEPEALARSLLAEASPSLRALFGK
jgi:hydroxymethylbilane synthase